jgi:hypothetical protein
LASKKEQVARAQHQLWVGYHTGHALRSGQCVRMCSSPSSNPDLLAPLRATLVWCLPHARRTPHQCQGALLESEAAQARECGREEAKIDVLATQLQGPCGILHCERACAASEVQRTRRRAIGRVEVPRKTLEHAWVSQRRRRLALFDLHAGRCFACTSRVQMELVVTLRCWRCKSAPSVLQQPAYDCRKWSRTPIQHCKCMGTYRLVP